MSETICVSPVNTTLNEQSHFVAVSPWSLPTYVVRPEVGSSDGPRGSVSAAFIDLPENVDVPEWLDATRGVLDFWDNDEDAVYDNY